jgi:predicted RNA-binding protein with EMAP domain
MVTISVSVGELIDKLSILQVKKNNISNIDKLNFIEKEFELLSNISYNYLLNDKISTLFIKLIEVNSKLWIIEDKLRILESEKNWGEEFVELARQVYFTNDERFFLKNEINNLTNSEIKEQKEYIKYN